MKYLTFFLFAILLAACGTQTGDVLTFRTADPKLSLAFQLLPAPPDAEVLPQATPDPEAVAIEEEEAPQVACEIKVNVSRDDIVYHLPGGVYYDRIKVDFSQGDFWACDEAEAIAAGARKSSR